MTKKIPVTLACLAMALTATGCSSHASADGRASASSSEWMAPSAPLEQVVSDTLKKASEAAGGATDVADLHVGLTSDGMVSMHGSLVKGKVVSGFRSMTSKDSDELGSQGSTVDAQYLPATATLPLAQVDAKQVAEQLRRARSGCTGENVDTELGIFAQLGHQRTDLLTCSPRGGLQKYTPVSITTQGKPAGRVEVNSVPSIQQAVADTARLLGSNQLTSFATSHAYGAGALTVTAVVPGTTSVTGKPCQDVRLQVMDPGQPTTDAVPALLPQCSPSAGGEKGVAPAVLTDTAALTKALTSSKADPAKDEVRALLSGDTILWDVSRRTAKEVKSIGSYSSQVGRG